VDAAAVVAVSPLPFVGARLSSPPRRRRPRHDYFIGARLLVRLTITFFLGGKTCCAFDCTHLM
jgi:hypothetical protein